jgi:hypothetical protein
LKNSTPLQNISFDEEQFIEDFSTLWEIALQAANIWPPFYVSSILGKPLLWLPIQRYSELTLINPWRLGRMLKYLYDIAIPALPFNPPFFTPPFFNDMFLRPSIIDRRPDHNGDYSTFPDEAWFFINGIMTNASLAQLNAAYLSDIFHRPITIIQNTTSSWAFDLAECAFGKQWKKEWSKLKEAYRKAFPPIYDALKSPDKKKVVIIAHSQGTIIASVVLSILKYLAGVEPELVSDRQPLQTLPASEGFLPVPETVPLERAPTAAPEMVFPYEGVLVPEDFEGLTVDELAKLEIYCFANCATHMTYHSKANQFNRPVPWIENFGNEFDIVARLGMLAPDKAEASIKIDGPIYMVPDAWGHLLNEHYLKPIERKQRFRLKRGGSGSPPAAPYRQIELHPGEPPSVPRLFSYINGGSPG